MNIGIVGRGFVGKALEFGFKDTHNLFIHDKFQKETLPLKEVLEGADVIFFCLPTPFDEETMHIDLEIYDEVIKEASSLVSNKLFVIKSTVIPETTRENVDPAGTTVAKLALAPLGVTFKVFDSVDPAA